MWVDYNVWDDSFFRERQVFLGHDQTDDAFLSMTTGELISQFWHALVTDTDFDEFASLAGSCYEDGVDDPGFAGSHIHTGVSHAGTFDFELFVFFQKSRWADSADKNVSPSHT